MATITDEQVERAFASGNGPKLVMEMRAALEAAQQRPVAVAEDPVREAAMGALATLTGAFSVDELRRKSLLNAATALREALAQPAPPSLTEDERKALLERTGGRPGWENPFALRSAREKLS